MPYHMWASLEAQLVKNLPANAGDPWVGKIPWRKDWLPTPVFLGFPADSDGKESACNVGGLGSVPKLGRSPGGEHVNPIQHSCLENPHGLRSLVGYSSWCHKKLGITEQLSTAHTMCSSRYFKCSYLWSSKQIQIWVFNFACPSSQPPHGDSQACPRAFENHCLTFS